jgi:microcin C transport system substrate-binding protein
MSRTAWVSACVGLALTAALLGPLISPAQAFVRGKPVHALALYGEPKFGADFKNFDYVNPDAPKGGTLVTTNGAATTFDTLNPFTLKGVAAVNAALMHDTLMVGGLDEPFTMYCLICETVEVAPDNTWVEFKLHPTAKFQDGSPITAEDIAFSFATLVEKGTPVYRLYWQDVAKVDVKDKLTARFVFKTSTNRELPAILGQLPILSKAYWSTRDFAETTLDVPVASGPYTIESFEVGRYVLFKRDPKYWAANLPVSRGTSNFDHIRVEYFRDNSVQFEAFKSGTFDFFAENTARRWATGYDFPGVKDGRVTKLEVSDGSPMAHQSVTFNLRRPLFQDRRVRQALGLAFDFEGLNKTVFYQQYTRLRSYWQQSDLEAKGLPSPAELALLEPLRDKVPPEVFTQEFNQATNNDQGELRTNLLKARDLLIEAGWVVRDGVLVKSDTGQPFAFEILENSPTMETVLNPWIQNLQRLGIKATMRVIDVTQFVNRINDFDFDATTIPGAMSLSPGNEQSEYWGSEAAERVGSQNYSGVKDPAVDVLIAKVVDAEDRPSLSAATRALDRVLTWNYYRMLTYSAPVDRLAYWDRLQRPAKIPLLGWGAAGAGVITMWWMDPAKAGAKP